MMYWNLAEALTYFVTHFTLPIRAFILSVLFLPVLYVLLFDLCKTQFGALPFSRKHYETQLKSTAQLIKQYYIGGCALMSFVHDSDVVNITSVRR